MNDTDTGIRFLTPETKTDVPSVELVFLYDELEKIAATDPPRPDVTTLIETLHVLEGPLPPQQDGYEADPRERAILLRAIVHLQNADQADRALTAFRDRLYDTGAVHWIAYLVRFVDPSRDFDFTSYSLAYEQGDRLVVGPDIALRVLDVNRERDPHELLADDWKEGAVVDRPHGFWAQ
jgi:hypothetical protein